MGAACAKELASRGAKVLIVDLNKSLGAAVAAEIDGRLMVGDVGDSTFCESVVSQVMADGGRLDCLVNAAGIIVRTTGEETSDHAWHRIMRVNVDGTFFMCRAAIKAMRPNGGSIVNFGSIWGDLGAVGAAAYCASKGAVHNLTRALALENAGQGIRVNAVCPGEVNTSMLASERSKPLTDDLLARLAATVPMGRLAEPEEIAKVVAFLASEGASYMTGSLVSVDAGYGAR